MIEAYFGLAVAGGLLAVGLTRPELYDEESGRWIMLSHDVMVEPGRNGTRLISVPAAALAAAAAAVH